MSIYYSLSNSIFVLRSTNKLWLAITKAQNELLKWERSKNPPPVSISQGIYKKDTDLKDGIWKLEVNDINPIPKIKVRKIKYEIRWFENNKEYIYYSNLFVKPPK